MSELDEVVREFLVESHEGLDQLDRNLVALEQRPGDRELLAAIFRCIHTIKGTCGFLGFGKLESVSHVGENLLSLLRDGKRDLTPEITNALLRLVDATRALLAYIEADGTEGDAEYGELIALLTELAERPGASRTAAKPARGKSKKKQTPKRRAAAGSADGPRLFEERRSGDDRRADADTRASQLSDSNIRVDVALLDRLMNLVGELVLARNQILQASAGVDNSAFQATTQRLNLITTELQEGVMKTRMQPIGNVWAKFPRVVRDLALACGKQVAIEMEGRETELDKTLIEAIRDPLTHIVRNSVDHGIESPEARRAAGKPAEGRLCLRAYHEGGQVNIEIGDDGGGIDAERVRQKALDRGLVTAEQAARMSERELQGLIFLPGFSTAEKVTNVSGRGVGMDVVKTNIEKIGGTVDIQSTAGQGTTLKIKIPLTLAIIPALTVTSGTERFAIPQVNLLELVRLDRNGGERGIEMIHGAPVYRLRGRLLPLAYLNRSLGLRELVSDVVNVVVLQADDRQFGLVVDEINDTEEIVVKPLAKQLKGLSVFTGATIMGDGRVALILDVVGLAQHAGVIGELRDRRVLDAAPPVQESADERTTLLVFGLGSDARMAIPLSTVARLEELPRESIERSAGREVVQYRGEILPLVRLTDVMNVPATAGDGPVQVVVYGEPGRQVGLVVDTIHDIVEDTLTIAPPTAHADLLGATVLQQRVVDLLDVQAVVRKACPWLSDAPAVRKAVA